MEVDAFALMGGFPLSLLFSLARREFGVTIQWLS
jgi:hypothetical protein